MQARGGRAGALLGFLCNQREQGEGGVGLPNVRCGERTWRVRREFGWQKLWMLPALAIFMKSSPVRPLR